MSCNHGSRSIPNLPKAINILTFVKKMNEIVPNFEKVYASLCEYAHPNWAGTLGAFGEIDKENFILHLGKTDRTNAYAISTNALSGTLRLFFYYYNASGELVKELNDHFESLS